MLRDTTGAFSPFPSFFPSTRAKGVSPSDTWVLIALCLLPQVSIYQILDKTEPDSPQGQKLLASRLLSLQGSGWEVFAITQAVSTFTLSWVAQSKKQNKTQVFCMLQLLKPISVPSGLAMQVGVHPLNSNTRACSLRGGMSSGGWMPCPGIVLQLCSCGPCCVPCAAAWEQHSPFPWLQLHCLWGTGCPGVAGGTCHLQWGHCSNACPISDTSSDTGFASPGSRLDRR